MQSFHGSLNALGKGLEEGQVSKGKVIYVFYTLNLWCLQSLFDVGCCVFCQIKISAYYSPKIKINHSQIMSTYPISLGFSSLNSL